MYADKYISKDTERIFVSFWKFVKLPVAILNDPWILISVRLFKTRNYSN